jgi:putative ABC transport system permease protein
MTTPPAQFVSVLLVCIRDWPARIGAVLVAVAGTAGTTFILVSVLAIANGVTDAIARAGAKDLAIVVQRSAPLEMSSSLTEEDISAIRASMNHSSLSRPLHESFVSPELVKMVDTISLGGEAGAQVVGRGIGPAGLRMREEFRIVEGRAFTPGTLEVVVGRHLAREFGGLEIGKTVTGEANDWVIVGVFEDGGGVSESEVWMDLETAREEGGARRDVSSMRIGVSSAADMSRLRARIESDPRRQLRLFSEAEYQAQQAKVLIGRVRLLALALALLLGTGAVIATINTMNSVVSDRQRSLATMRALGFGAGPAATAVFAEATLLGVAGGILGATLAYVLTDGYGLALLNATTQAPVALDAVVTFNSAVYGVIAGTILGAVAAVLPSVRVARMPILVGLRGM